MQGERAKVGREPTVLTHLEGACDPESPEGNWFTHPRMGTSLQGHPGKVMGKKSFQGHGRLFWGGGRNCLPIITWEIGPDPWSI